MGKMGEKTSHNAQNEACWASFGLRGGLTTELILQKSNSLLCVGILCVVESVVRDNLIAAITTTASTKLLER
jgi:hypothetical protein